MKKSQTRIFLFAMLFITLFLGFSGCNNLTSTANDKKTGDEKKAYFNVSVNDDIITSRTALPSFTRDSIKGFAFTLKGTNQANPQESDWETFGTFDDTSSSANNLASLEAVSLDVSTGDWTFVLTAEKEGTKLIAQVTKTIALGENTINFSLAWDDSALDSTKTGSLSFTVDFSQAPNASDVTRVTAQLYSYDITTSTATEITGADASKYQAIELTPTSSTATYSLQEIPAGNYKIEILLYVQDSNTNNTTPIQIMPPLHELAIITGGQESAGSRTINSFNELYTIEWHNLDGASAPETLPLNYSRFSDSYTLPSSGLSKTGYTFGGWYEDSACEGTEVTTLAKGTTGKKDFYAKWNPNTNTPYVVKHWKQKVSGNVNSHNATNYELVSENDTESKTGITDQLVEFELKDTSTTNKTDPFYGFNPPSSSEITAAQALTISGDGSRVVNLYYPRKTVTVMYKDEILHVSPYPKTLATYRYGQTVSVSELPTSKGTVFLGWSLQQSPGDSDTLYNMNTNTYRYVLDSIDPVTFYAQWAYSKINDTYYPSFERTMQTIENIPDDSEITITLYSLATAEQIGSGGVTGTIIRALSDTQERNVTVNFNIAKNSGIELVAGVNSETFIGCANFVSIDISGLKSVEVLANFFAECRSLTSFEFLDNFDMSKMRDQTLEGVFRNCLSLTSIDLSKFDTSNIGDMQYLFYGCSSLETIDLSNFDTAKVNNMLSMFEGCTNLTTIYASHRFVITSVGSDKDTKMFTNCDNLEGGSGSKFSVLKKTDKTYAKLDGGEGDEGYFTLKTSSGAHYAKIDDTFYDNYNDTKDALLNLSEAEHTVIFYSIPAIDIGSTTDDTGALLNTIKSSTATAVHLIIDESANIDFGYYNEGAFQNGTQFVSIDLSGVKSATTLHALFKGCTNLQSVTFANDFDTSSVAEMREIFTNCTSLTEVDISSFDTDSVQTTEAMFYGCTNLTTIYASNSFVIPNTAYGEFMFNDCNSLVGGSGTKFSDLKIVDASVARIDEGPKSAAPGYFTYKAPSNSVTVTFNTMGGSAIASQTLASGSYAARPKTPLKDNFVFDGWYTDTDYNNPFDITATPIVSDITLYAKWELNTHYAKIDGTFYDSYGDAKNVVNTLSAGEHTVIFYSILADDLGSTSYPGSMIYGIMQSQATAVHLIIHETANIDLGTNNEATFYNGDKFVSIDLSGVKRANFLGSMFSHCSNLQSVTFADDFDTSYVEDMREMFSGCTMLTEVDLTSFKTNKVKYSDAMFLECSSLTTIYASSSFIIPSSVTSVDMFAGCNSLVGGNGTKYAVAQITNGEFARLDTSSTPGYFSKKPVAGLSCNVGDVILNDGTVIPYVAGTKLNEQQSAAAIAVIFYDGTGSLGDKPLGIGLYQPTSLKPLMLENAAGSDTTLASDNNSGKVFTQAIYSCSDYNGNLYPAFGWLEQYFKATSGALDSSVYKDGWYLPAKNELLEIYSKMEAINQTLNMINNKNAMGFVTDIPYFAAYQSPAKVNFAGYLSFQTGAWAEDCPKKEEFQIRAIHEF